MERLESELSNFVLWSGMGISSVCRAGIEKPLFGKGSYPHYELKHGVRKVSKPINTSGGRIRVWWRNVEEGRVGKIFRMLDILNTYV